MAHMSTHIPFYEGDEYPRRHWFLYESTWESNVVTNGEWRMTQFASSLQKQALTWYMIYTEKTRNATKAQIKKIMTFFKTTNEKYLEENML